jgi:hypothetical protein
MEPDHLRAARRGHSAEAEIISDAGFARYVLQGFFKAP